MSNVLSAQVCNVYYGQIWNLSFTKQAGRMCRWAKLSRKSVLCVCSASSCWGSCWLQQSSPRSQDRPEHVPWSSCMQINFAKSQRHTQSLISTTMLLGRFHPHSAQNRITDLLHSKIHRGQIYSQTTSIIMVICYPDNISSGNNISMHHVIWFLLSVKKNVSTFKFPHHTCILLQFWSTCVSWPELSPN